jgi:cobalt-zinc-cadmium efflux system outer membrane protein
MSMHRLLVSALTCGAALAGPSLPARADVTTSTPTLTLDAAIQRAFQASPELAEAQAAVGEARARRLGAGLLANPELSARGAARLLDQGARPDVAVELSQALPLGGQRGDRTVVADDEIREAEARLTHARQALATRVHLAFIEASRAQELSELATASVQLTKRLLAASERRLAVGDSAALDVHVARAELGRADDALTRARVDAVAARVTLAVVMGEDALSRVHLAPPPVTERVLPPLAQVLSEAKARRADLEALRIAVETARARVELARSGAVPSLTLTAFFELEGGSEVIVGGGLSLPLPFFDRNQGGIAEAVATTARQQAELRRGELEVSREVATAYELYTSATGSQRAFEGQVVSSMEETVDLLQRSFDAGKIGFTEVLVLRRSLIEARAMAAETRARAAQAGVVLDVAMGTMVLPAGAEQEK